MTHIAVNQANLMYGINLTFSRLPLPGSTWEGGSFTNAEGIKHLYFQWTSNKSLQISRVLINVFSGSSNKDYQFWEKVIMENINKLLIFRLKCYTFFSWSISHNCWKSIKKGQRKPHNEYIPRLFGLVYKIPGVGEFRTLKERNTPIPLP